MVGPIFDIFNKNRRNLPKITKIGPTTHFCYFFLVIRSCEPEFFILEYEFTNTEEYFAIFFFPNFNVLGTLGYPKWLPLGVKTPKMIFFGSNFFLIWFFVLKLKDWHQDCPFTTKNGWDMAFWSFRGTRGPQNFKPP